jgi:protein phosphatase
MRDAISGIEAGAATHIGKVRQHNEDNYLVATHRGLWAVADGMGGHEAGDVASRVVMEELDAVVTPSTAAELFASCEASMIVAKSRLKEMSDERGFCRHHDCSLACVRHVLRWRVVGDSRIYRIRGQGIEQITLDHSEIQELVSEGKLNAEEARTWPRRNVITRAIGVRDDPELEMKSGTLEPGDIFVLCTDGLTAHLEDTEILALAGQHRAQEACDLLVDLTLDRGAAEKVTVVIAQLKTAKTRAASKASMVKDICK